MEMKLDRHTIKALRSGRAWTQEQLAAATGLSLRTIQRIERTGTAAGESTQALAAVFEVRVHKLLCAPSVRGQFGAPARIGLGFAAGAVAGFALMSGVTASAVDLKVKTFFNDTPVAERTQQNGDQRPITVSLSDRNAREQARLRILTSELDSGNVRFDLVIYNCDAKGCTEAGRPAMETRFGEPAKVEWDKPTGEVIAYELTPTR